MIMMAPMTILRIMARVMISMEMMVLLPLLHAAAAADDDGDDDDDDDEEEEDEDDEDDDDERWMVIVSFISIKDKIDTLSNECVDDWYPLR